MITKKNCLGIFAASMRMISAMTGNSPELAHFKFVVDHSDIGKNVRSTSHDCNDMRLA